MDHQQVTANSGKNLNTQYTNSRIDDILLPANVARRVAFISKCCLGYQSDHIPIYTTITTDILNRQLQRPQTNQPMKGNKTKALVRPISEADQLSFTNAILDPAYRLLQKLEVIQRSLNPIYNEARGFLTNLESKSAKSTFKLRELGNRKATEVVEEQAQAITYLLYAANKVALEVCTTTLAGTNTGQHYINRPTSKKRQKLTKQLNTMKCLKSHLSSVASSAMSFEEL